MKGTGFAVEGGFIVTNNHVVQGCSAAQLGAVSSLGEQIKFTRILVDEKVDLAILKPETQPRNVLKLHANTDLPVGTAVSTWGYPLQFNGPNPLLSSGYIAGYLEDGGGNKVKHLVINGAINPGNSGGPLFRSGDDKVIGIIVAKFLPFSPLVSQIIGAMSQNTSGVVYTQTAPDGTKKDFSEGQLVASVLNEFYAGTQVMIGEAISVSELQHLLNTRGSELAN